MRVVFGADHDAEALETHRHHFGGMSVDWDLGDVDVVERGGRTHPRDDIDVLAGGPPASRSRRPAARGCGTSYGTGLRDPHDQRRDLWRSFLEVVGLARPRP